MNVRKTGGRGELDSMWSVLASLTLLVGNSTYDQPGVGDGTTNGNLRTTASADFRVAGIQYTKAATDDLWDLSGETATGAAEYRAYWLLVDSAGAASFAASGEQASEALALEDLPALDGTKSVLGVFVAGPSTDFTSALAAQGGVYDAIPEGAHNGAPGGHINPQPIELVGA